MYKANDAAKVSHFWSQRAGCDNVPQQLHSSCRRCSSIPPSPSCTCCV
jgi:hypothetical protein